jgi:hypothetical protein
MLKRERGGGEGVDKNCFCTQTLISNSKQWKTNSKDVFEKLKIGFQNSEKNPKTEIIPHLGFSTTDISHYSLLTRNAVIEKSSFSTLT